LSLTGIYFTYEHPGLILVGELVERGMSHQWFYKSLFRSRLGVDAGGVQERNIMGFMDKLGNLLGDTKSTATDTVKGPSQTLRENGIDPSNLKFSFNQDGTVGVSGHAASQSECDRICEVIKTIPSVSGVKNNIIIGTPEPVPAPGPEVEVAADQGITAKSEKAGRTYTVQAGDTLWAIAEKMYGSGGKYMKIFEANTPVLENPDKIFPGQELVIPDLDT
jgi:hypothetical protein